MQNMELKKLMNNAHVITMVSGADITTTQTLISAGEMMGINILDHLVIVRGGGYTSIRERYNHLWN